MGKYDVYSWAARPEPIPESEIVRTEESDVVVVGAGLSGVTAALSAAQNGLSVTVIEKARRNSARGFHIAAANSRLLKKYGVENDVDELTDAWISATGHRAKSDVIRTYLKASEPAMNWLLDIAESNGMNVKIYGGHYKGKTYKEYVVTHLFPGGAEPVAAMIVDEGKKAGAKYVFNTSACQLIQDDSGRVTGVIAKNSEGYIRFMGKKGVILATGDISGNPEMCRDLAPQALTALRNINHHSPQLTGDGHRMGVWAGASMQDAPFPCAIHLMASLLNAYFFLMVNQKGKRYMNEDAWGQGKTTYTMRQDPKHPWGYVIYDSKWKEEVIANDEYGGGLFWDSVMRELGAPFNADGDEFALKKAVQEGVAAWQADTLDELAEKIGVPVDEFGKTIGRYNELCFNGHDDDFGKRKEFMTPIWKAPFYAVKVSGMLLHIPAGLSVDTRMNVLNEDGDEIPGLYAIGNVAGDLYGIDYPLVMAGNNHGRCITFGWLVGRLLAGIEEF